MGCLTAPFKLIGCLGLLAALALGWLYRDRLVREGRRLLSGNEAPAAATEGRPGRVALQSARAKVDSLNGWRADSVVLSPPEVASLIGAGLDPELRGELDSMQVRLLDGEIQLRARLRTARLPREMFGPLTGVLRETEPVEAAGPLEVTGPGQGEWRVRSFEIRGFPLPADAVPRLMARAVGDSGGRAVPVRIPKGIREVRVRPTGATLYGAPRP
ncbi:MAG: hypothetical protein H0W29_14070 [Gemmatimonadales bacterium]|nr:hypothetical protein [Gemmatimonadales bacterium]